MTLVPSLLQAIVHVDGDTLVMHAGDKPYVVTPAGRVELATRGLSHDALNGIVQHLLPAGSKRALDGFGAVQYELPPSPEFPAQHFTVVAARDDEDYWVEIRRRRTVDLKGVLAEFFEPPEAAPAVSPDGAAAWDRDDAGVELVIELPSSEKA